MEWPREVWRIFGQPVGHGSVVILRNGIAEPAMAGRLQEVARPSASIPASGQFDFCVPARPDTPARRFCPDLKRAFAGWRHSQIMNNPVGFPLVAAGFGHACPSSGKTFSAPLLRPMSDLPDDLTDPPGHPRISPHLHGLKQKNPCDPPRPLVLTAK